MLKTKRLIIRPYTIEDAKEAFALFNDIAVMEFIPSGTDKVPNDTVNRVIKYISHYNTYGFSKYVILEKNTNRLIGDCGICRIENTDINELGYRIKKEFWNQGFATEAAIAVIDYAFKFLKFREIHAIVESKNIKSVYILENKLGFSYTGELFCYGQNFDLYRLEN